MTTRTRRFSPGVRKTRQWGLVNVTIAIISAAHATAVAVDLQNPLETAIGSNLHNVTVSAMRILISMNFQATCVAGDQANVFYGVTWATNDAIAAGALSLPEPTTDHSDWIAHGNIHAIADTAGVIQMPRFGQQMLVNDSMRKQRENA